MSYIVNMGCDYQGNCILFLIIIITLKLCGHCKDQMAWGFICSEHSVIRVELTSATVFLYNLWVSLTFVKYARWIASIVLSLYSEFIKIGQ